ncbi:MAG: hypothetical protein A2287_04830 [Candidatus Melainabacteria bacterium RIFOXYA12_FULL_32_12]|nr:MAG: hypothetical protein A2255_03555 [Candidatus Melainabacteria bacterium RIFOXYA2_FULL_32_9]OGI29840.1 MAG: hypothetical protein A2287_04830 [Candidatus Melainabacteria bacterium RIFOXYA12_FULL_32_12]
MTTAKYLSGTLLVLLTMNFQAFGMPQKNSDLINIEFQRPSTEQHLAQANNINTQNEFKEIISDMKYQLLSAQNEIEKLQETNYQLKNSLDQKEQQIKELSQPNKYEVITTLNTKDNEIDKLKTLIATYEQKIQSLSQINNNKVAILSTKDDEINELKTLTMNHKQKINDLSLQLVNLTNELNKTKDNFLAYSQKNTQLINDNMTLHESYLDLQSKITNLKSQIEQEKTLEANLKAQNIHLKAIEYLKKDKNNAALFYFNLAKAYQDSKDYQQSIENYNMTLTINPNFKEAYRELGIAYAEAGKYNDSIKTLNTYLKYSNSLQEEQLVKSFISRIEKAMQS